jgi:pimeloyl-ACP methyl ester carboxylesterase
MAPAALHSRKSVHLILAGVLALSLGLPAAASAHPPDIVPGKCRRGTLPDGALTLICVPKLGWNGDLVIFAHGYVAFNEPLDAYESQLTLSDGTYLPDLVQSLGFAFATTSYRRNGLAILEGADDIRQLIEAFPDETHGHRPIHTYLTGASEGGIITALLAERHPELFTGALSACGPIGNFRQQLNFWGDFRVLFDYFFPGLLPPSPIDIPPDVIARWESVYEPAIAAAVAGRPLAASELIRTSRAATDPQQPITVVSTTLNLLWYNVFATNDGLEQLDGSPYDNTGRLYFGSSNDLRLNRRVQRFTADPGALDNVAPYETSGHLTIPMVTLHTTGDELIPFWHEVLYFSKTRQSGGRNLLPIPIIRYGHCNFKAAEMLAAFGVLVWKATGSLPDLPAEAAQLSQQFATYQFQTLFLPMVSRPD